MRVKRLEVQGFKSFKDKTVIHFDHSITGIVGPNGCGKSNIVDAFFWVMGEQSYKHMRGASSDDLIFNGSSRYSPLGMAEATLVMETDVPNAEAAAGATTKDIAPQLKTKEIAVTRRVYRTGEGEYFINGVPARLKDIHELFMDTGVGAKGYSVIEQGQIGRIVNSKPEERRLLIEEAAGIAKYKARKKESLRKMEQTEANLSRLNDVIQEIERNLDSLERQAQKARLYNKYKEELLDKEMTWGRRKAKVYRQKLEALRIERDTVEQELNSLRVELQVTENTIESDRISQVTETKLAEELQAKVQSLSAELTRQQSALDLSRRRQGDLNEQLTSMQREKEELQESLLADRERLTTLEGSCLEADEALSVATDSALSEDEKVRLARAAADTARKTLDQKKRDLMSAVGQGSDLNSRAAALSSKVESAEIQAAKLEQQLQTLNERVAQLREESQAAIEASTNAKAKLEELQEGRKEGVARVQTLEQKVKQSDQDRVLLDRQLTQLRSRLQSLEELAAAHEGFADGPKAALEWASNSGNKEHFRAIAEALDVTSGYEPVLEAWLEGRLENLIAEDPSVGIGALDAIREGKQGRASVHVDQDWTSDSKKENFDSLKTELTGAGFEVVGKLSDFAGASKSSGNLEKQAIDRMVASVCVVNSFAPVPGFVSNGGVRKLAEAGNWSIVSLDGNVLDCRGILRGGSMESDRTASFLVRKRAIADLQTEVTAADEKLNQAIAVVEQSKTELDAAKETLEEISSQLRMAEIDNATKERDVQQINRTLRESESQLELAELDASEMRDEAIRAREQRAEIEAGIQELASKRVDLEDSIAEAEERATTLEAELRQQEEELQRLKVMEASLRERAVSAKRELEQSRSMVQEHERRLAEVERVLDRASREREQFTGNDGEIEEKIEELLKGISINQESLSLAKDRLEQISARLNSGLESIKELHSKSDKKNNKSTQLALEVEKLAGDLNHLVQNLEEKYGQGCLELPVTSPIQEEMNEPVVTTEMTAEEEQALGEQVEKLRERIRRLGEVNVMAIEDYENLKKRYDVLLTEKRDLEKSMENLQEAIDHINKTSEERFKKAFEAIADRFEKLFPIIFGGGQAKLSLIYPENSQDILEAGVDILAQPPGKKVANITLLSGGEKALTAVSLIFAVFMVKPSPFCILDEVDAPLDDANIGKFNALLREMSAKSQFILITHNKRTMELNDTLYGVTMEEPGVSKMVSIEMR